MAARRTDNATRSDPAARPPRPRIGPRVVLGAVVVLLAWLAVGGVGGQSIGQLSSVQKNDNASFLPPDAESTKVDEAARAFSDQGTLPLIVVAERGAALTPADLTAAQAFAATLPRLPLDLAGTSATVGDYLVAPQVAAVPSKDGTAFLVVLPLSTTKTAEKIGDATPLTVITTAVKAAVETGLQKQGYTAYVTGPAGFIGDLVSAFAGIDGILLLVALGVVLVILLVVYRSPVLPFAVLLTAGFGLSAAGLVVYKLAEAGHITVTGQSQGILSILVVGAATDYSLLLVARYKEELHDQESTWVALRTAWRATVEPIAASAATVVLGLLSLTLAELKGTSGLGPVGALGILGALIAALTLLPALLLLGRRWIFWPAIPRVDHAHRSDSLDAGRGWGRIARFVGARPRATWVVTALVLLAAAAFLPTLKSDGISQSDTFLTKVDAVKGQEVLARHFDAGSGSPVLVIAPSAVVDAVVAALGTEAGVSNPYAGQAPARPPRSWRARCSCRRRSPTRPTHRLRSTPCGACGPTCSGSAPTCWWAARPPRPSTCAPLPTATSRSSSRPSSPWSSSCSCCCCARSSRPCCSSWPTSCPSGRPWGSRRSSSTTSSTSPEGTRRRCSTASSSWWPWASTTRSS